MSVLRFLLFIGAPIWFFGLVLLSGGCASSPQTGAIADDTPLVSGDCLAITFLGGDSSEEPKPKFYVVDSSGGILLPLVSNVKVAGLSPQEAKQRIEHEYVPKYFSHIELSLRRCH